MKGTLHSSIVTGTHIADEFAKISSENARILEEHKKSIEQINEQTKDGLRNQIKRHIENLVERSVIHSNDTRKSFIEVRETVGVLEGTITNLIKEEQSEQEMRDATLINLVLSTSEKSNKLVNELDSTHTDDMHRYFVITGESINTFGEAITDLIKTEQSVQEKRDNAIANLIMISDGHFGELSESLTDLLNDLNVKRYSRPSWWDRFKIWVKSIRLTGES